MRLIAPIAALAVLAAIASPTNAAEESMTVAKGSVQAGAGSSVTFQGNPLPLVGNGIKVGDALPAATLTGAGLKPVNIAEAKGKVRIINVVPSLDTPVCDAQTHELAEKDPTIAEKIDLVTVSMDLPFAQARWSRAAKVKGVTFLSDYQSAQFGMSNGLLIEPLHLLARAVIVTDQDGVVRYLQVVPEITELPDMGAAMEAAKGLL